MKYQDIIDSWINGQKKQCARQYLELLDYDTRKEFAAYCEIVQFENYSKLLEYVIEYTLKDLRDNYVQKDIYEY